MPKGGLRAGAGRKRTPKVPFATRARVRSVLNKLGKPYWGVGLPAYQGGKRLPTEDDLWLGLILNEDKRLRLETIKYLKNRLEGEPSQKVNHTIQHLIAIEEGRTLSRQMLALKKQRRLLEVHAEPAAEENAQDAPAETPNKDDGTSGTSGNS